MMLVEGDRTASGASSFPHEPDDDPFFLHARNPTTLLSVRSKDDLRSPRRALLAQGKKWKTQALSLRTGRGPQQLDGIERDPR